MFFASGSSTWPFRWAANLNADPPKIWPQMHVGNMLIRQMIFGGSLIPRHTQTVIFLSFSVDFPFRPSDAVRVTTGNQDPSDVGAKMRMQLKVNSHNCIHTQKEPQLHPQVQLNGFSIILRQVENYRGNTPNCQPSPLEKEVSSGGAIHLPLLILALGSSKRRRCRKLWAIGSRLETNSQPSHNLPAKSHRAVHFPTTFSRIFIGARGKRLNSQVWHQGCRDSHGVGRSEGGGLRYWVSNCLMKFLDIVGCLESGELWFTLA